LPSSVNGDGTNTTVLTQVQKDGERPHDIKVKHKNAGNGDTYNDKRQCIVDLKGRNKNYHII